MRVIVCERTCPYLFENIIFFFFLLHIVCVYVCVCVPVLAVLDALAQRGSLSQRRVSTATCTGGQDAILKGERKKMSEIKKCLTLRTE